MSNPVLVEVTRGGVVESRHRGAASVFDADGKARLQIGDTALPVFPRSAIKAVQALPLMESGAADALGLSDAEISLACASHSGEEFHVEAARSMLTKAGLDESALECGGHWSFVPRVMLDQARKFDATPDAICNNCSGKHAGFLCTAVHTGTEPRGYVYIDHKVQRDVRRALEEVTDAPHAEDHCGTDGCSIPTFAVPLDAMAQGFAKMATGAGFDAHRARAAARILSACMENPAHMAGTGRFCTRIMQLGKGRIFAKTGAEGVFCAALPDQGFGIALKCDDGTTRASECMMAALLVHLLPADDPLREGLEAMAHVTLKNWNGIEVGTIRPAGPLAG